MSKFLPIILSLFTICFIVSCSDDDDDDDDVNACNSLNATYDGSIKTIVDGSCAYTGCHDGTGINTLIPATAIDFTSYAGMMASLESGAVNTRAIVEQTMPPAAFVPNGFPTELTDAQLELLTCWHEAGYPEN